MINQMSHHQDPEETLLINEPWDPEKMKGKNKFSQSLHMYKERVKEDEPKAN